MVSFLNVSTGALTGDGFSGTDPSGQWFGNIRRATDGKILAVRNTLSSSISTWRLVNADLSGYVTTPEIQPSDFHFSPLPATVYIPRKCRLNLAGTYGYIGSLRQDNSTFLGSALIKIRLSDLTRVDEWLAVADSITVPNSQEFYFMGVSPDETKAYFSVKGGPAVQNIVYKIDLATSAVTIFATIGVDVGGSGVPRDNLISDGIVLSDGRLVVATFNTSGSTTDIDGFYLHVITTGGVIASSTNVPLLDPGLSSAIPAMVQDPDGTLWGHLIGDSLFHFNVTTQTILSQIALPLGPFSSQMNIRSLTIGEIIAPPPSHPPPVVVASHVCCMDPDAPVDNWPGDVLPPVGTDWESTCEGGGIPPDADDLTGAETWE